MEKKENKRICPHCGTDFTNGEHNLTLTLDSENTIFYTCDVCGKDFKSSELIVNIEKEYPKKV